MFILLIKVIRDLENMQRSQNSAWSHFLEKYTRNPSRIQNIEKQASEATQIIFVHRYQ